MANNSKISLDYVFREANVPQGDESVDRNTKLVKNGSDNLYPQRLFGWVEQSPVHGGIVYQKTEFIYGDGVEILSSQGDIVQDNGDSKLSLNEVIEKIAFDNEVLSYFYLLFKKGFSGVWYVELLDGEKMRTDESMTRFEYSDDWSVSKQSPEKTGWKEYKSFFQYNPEVDTELVMYVKSPSKQTVQDNGDLTLGIYPKPKYNGAIPSIMADIEMNYFHYSESVNGWTSNTILSLLDGVPEPPEKRKILKELKDQVTDRKKKGGMMVLFGDGKERAAEVLNLNGNNNDTRYLLTQEHGFQTMMIAHRVQNPALFALQVEGKLGNTSSDQLLQDFKRFIATYGKKARGVILEPITYGLSILNNWADLEIAFKEFIPEWIVQQVDGDNKVADALNQMSPLVASKVLDNLTPNEIRSLGKLPPIEGGDVISKPTAFSKELNNEVIDLFKKSGVDRSQLNFIHSREFDYKATDDQYKSEFLSMNFNEDLTEDQRRILEMVRNGESYKSIVDALGLGARQTSVNIMRLTSLGYIDPATQTTTWSLSDTGTTAVANQESINVFYTYELRPDAPDLVEGGKSRDFCTELIGANRAYTREEINLISAAIGRDVWLYRGGWYHDPDTDKNQPSCRHFWKQNIVLS